MHAVVNAVNLRPVFVPGVVLATFYGGNWMCSVGGAASWTRRPDSFVESKGTRRRATHTSSHEGRVIRPACSFSTPDVGLFVGLVGLFYLGSGPATLVLFARAPGPTARPGSVRCPVLLFGGFLDPCQAGFGESGGEGRSRRPVDPLRRRPWEGEAFLAPNRSTARPRSRECGSEVAEPQARGRRGGAEQSPTGREMPKAVDRRPASRTVTWLILPVVICLSQRLSHACLSISESIQRNCEWLIKSVIVYLMVSYYLDNRGNSRANTCERARLFGRAVFIRYLTDPGRPGLW